MTVIRAATPEDARAISDVRLISWRATYGPLLPEHVWDEADPAADAQRLAARIADGSRRALVAEVDGAIRAFSTFGPCRDDDLADIQEIYAIYAHPQSWSTGLGRGLMTATLAALGAGPVVLWVLEDNTRARRFYEIAGFRPDGARKPADMLGGIQLPELRYRRP